MTKRLIDEGRVETLEGYHQPVADPKSVGCPEDQFTNVIAVGALVAALVATAAAIIQPSEGGRHKAMQPETHQVQK